MYNPPYLNVDDTWGKGDSRLAALKKLYPNIYNDKTDILFYFLGRAIQLSKGYICFIVSRAFLEAYKADKLRAYLLLQSSIQEVIDFRNFYVFSGVGITTCIITLRRDSKPGIIQAYKLLMDVLPSGDLQKLRSNPEIFEQIEISQESLRSSAWAMASSTVSGLNEKIDRMGDPLNKILIIGQGMQTGQNDVFGKRTLKEVTQWRLKPGQFYKRASNSDIQRYFIQDRGEYIFYPQYFTNYEQLPKGVQKHLMAHVDELKGRAAYKRGDCEWWKFTWPLHEEHYDHHRIICPYLASSNRFALDTNKEFLSLTDTTVLFENKQQESLLYLLGLLNSRLLTFRFRSIGKLKGGNIYEYFWNSISKLPIRRINLPNPADKSRHDKMVALVESMLALCKRVTTAKTDHERTLLKRQISATDREIDRLVYELYGLTDSEIAIVEERGDRKDENRDGA